MVRAVVHEPKMEGEVKMVGEGGKMVGEVVKNGIVGIVEVADAFRVSQVADVKPTSASIPSVCKAFLFTTRWLSVAPLHRSPHPPL